MATDQTGGEQVMFMAAIGLRGQTEGHAPSKTPLAAALLGILILVSVAVNGLIVVADGTLRQPALTGKLAR
jgi:hypothetical protein